MCKMEKTLNHHLPWLEINLLSYVSSNTQTVFFKKFFSFLLEENNLLLNNLKQYGSKLFFLSRRRMLVSWPYHTSRPRDRTHRTVAPWWAYHMSSAVWIFLINWVLFLQWSSLCPVDSSSWSYYLRLIPSRLYDSQALTAGSVFPQLPLSFQTNELVICWPEMKWPKPRCRTLIYF